MSETKKIDPDLFTTKTQVIRVLEGLMMKGTARCKMHEERLGSFEQGQVENRILSEKILEQNKSIFRTLERFDKVIVTGNGKPGLITRVEMIEEKHKTHVELTKEAKTDKKFNIANTITVVIAALMMIITIWSVYKTEVKLENKMQQLKVKRISP